jgi:hypothetical protein
MNTQHWANIGDDEGALHALLGRVRHHVPVDLIDYLWIFPPRRIAAGESIVIVVAAFDHEPVRKRVITAHFTISRNRKGQAFVNARFDEHGSAPGLALTRIVDGVLHRLGEDADTTLHEHQIGGDIECWNALIRGLGGTPHTSTAPIHKATGGTDFPQHAATPSAAPDFDATPPHPSSDTRPA